MANINQRSFIEMDVEKIKLPELEGFERTLAEEDIFDGCYEEGMTTYPDPERREEGAPYTFHPTKDRASIWPKGYQEMKKCFDLLYDKLRSSIQSVDRAYPIFPALACTDESKKILMPKVPADRREFTRVIANIDLLAHAVALRWCDKFKTVKYYISVGRVHYVGEDDSESGAKASVYMHRINMIRRSLMFLMRDNQYEDVPFQIYYLPESKNMDHNDLLSSSRVYSLAYYIGNRWTVGMSEAVMKNFQEMNHGIGNRSLDVEFKYLYNRYIQELKGSKMSDRQAYSPSFRKGHTEAVKAKEALRNIILIYAKQYGVVLKGTGKSTDLVTRVRVFWRWFISLIGYDLSYNQAQMITDIWSHNMRNERHFQDKTLAEFRKMNEDLVNTYAERCQQSYVPSFGYSDPDVLLKADGLTKLIDKQVSSGSFYSFWKEREQPAERSTENKMPVAEDDAKSLQVYRWRYGAVTEL